MRSGRRRWTPIAAVIAALAGLTVATLSGCQSATRVIAPRATFQQGEERREIEIRIEPRDGETKRDLPVGMGDEVGAPGSASRATDLATRDFTTPENKNGYEIGCNDGHENVSDVTFAPSADLTPVAYREAAFTRENTGEMLQSNKAAKQQNRTSDVTTDDLDDIGDVISEAVRAGSSVHVRVTETRPASSYAEQGAGLTSKSDQAAMEFSTGLRSVVLPWGQAEGGVSGFTGKIAGKSVNVLHVLGGLTLIAAVIPVVLKPRRVGLAAAIAGAGVALIAAGTVAEQAPWVLILAFIAFVGTLAWLGISAWRSGQLAEGIKPVVAGVEALPESLQKAVKSSIERKAGAKIETTRAVVRRAKKQVGIVGKTTGETPPVGTGAAGGG